MLMRSVFPASSGVPIRPLGEYITDHRSPAQQRWGGWYVTGHSGSIRHMGNSTVTNSENPDPMRNSQNLNLESLKDEFDTNAYLSPYSDIAALMVFEHQMRMMNLLTRVAWEARQSQEQQNRPLIPNNSTIRSAGQLQDAVNELVDYLLFVDEAPLKSKIQGTSGFTEKFAAQGPRDSRGRSLRQLDLEHRLMSYPCSYMIYSAVFDSLPAAVKSAIYRRVWQILSGAEKSTKYAHLALSDRRAVVEILRETKPDLPDFFGRVSR
jgi:hypothetical protein